MKNNYHEMMKYIDLDDPARKRILKGVENAVKKRQRRKKQLGMLLPAAAAAVLALVIGTSGLLGSPGSLKPSDPAVFNQQLGGTGGIGDAGNGSGISGGPGSGAKDSGTGSDAVPFKDSGDTSSGDTTDDNSQDRSQENPHYHSSLTAAMKDCGFDSCSDIVSICIYSDSDGLTSDDPRILKNAEQIGRMYRILTGGSWQDFDSSLISATGRSASSSKSSSKNRQYQSDRQDDQGRRTLQSQSGRSAEWIRIDFKLKNGKTFRTGVDPKNACLYILCDDGTLVSDKNSGGTGCLQLQTNDLAWIISLISGK